MSAPNIPCLWCGSGLVNIMEDRGGNQPSGGLEFITAGHYGSTEFDPMDGTKLAINICDLCLKDGRDAKRILVIRNGKYAEWAKP